MTTTETKCEYPSEAARKVIDSLEEEVKRAECMEKTTNYEPTIADLWRKKSADFRTAAEMIRRAYL